MSKTAHLAPKALDSIQMLRALAAIAVVIFHGVGTLWGWGPRPTAVIDPIGMAQYGHLGVDLFFVLSGFILVWVHQRDFQNVRNLPNYLSKRLIRIYPTYWVIFCSFEFLKSIVGTLPDWKLLIGNFLLLPQSEYLIGPAWSLTYELYFYLLLSGRFFASKPLAWVSIGIYIAVVLLKNYTPALESLLSAGWAIPISIYTLEFFWGGICAEVLNSRFSGRGNKVNSLLLALGVVGFAAGLLIDARVSPLQQASPGASNLRPFLFGIPFAILIAGFVLNEMNAARKIRIPRLLVRIGDASYALYIFHMIPLFAVLKVAPVLREKGTVVLTSTLALYLCFVITIALLFTKYIEKPLNQYLRGKFEITREKPKAQEIPDSMRSIG